MPCRWGCLRSRYRDSFGLFRRLACHTEWAGDDEQQKRHVPTPKPSPSTPSHARRPPQPCPEDGGATENSSAAAGTGVIASGVQTARKKPTRAADQSGGNRPYFFAMWLGKPPFPSPASKITRVTPLYVRITTTFVQKNPVLPGPVAMNRFSSRPLIRGCRCANRSPRSGGR